MVAIIQYDSVAVLLMQFQTVPNPINTEISLFAKSVVRNYVVSRMLGGSHDGGIEPPEPQTSHVRHIIPGLGDENHLSSR